MDTGHLECLINLSLLNFTSIEATAVAAGAGTVLPVLPLDALRIDYVSRTAGDIVAFIESLKEICNIYKSNDSQCVQILARMMTPANPGESH